MRNYFKVTVFLLVVVLLAGCSGVFNIDDQIVLKPEETKVSFDRDNLVEFEVKEKVFGEYYSTPRFRSNNFFSIQEDEKESIRVSVSRETYEKYEVGDVIRFYVDEKNEEHLLDEDGDYLVRIID